MFIVKRFLGEELNRFNSIIDSYNLDQNSRINLTACSSYPFQEVLDVQKMPLCTLPTEGTLGKRFFPICRSLDEIEEYAQELALNLFNIKETSYMVSVQPNSGTQANQIVFNAILDDGDTVLSLNPRDGGHISHTKMGGRNIKVKYFVLNTDLEVDYNYLEDLLKTYHPKLVIVGASSYVKEFDYQKISIITNKHGAKLLADICHSVLYVIGHVHRNIFPYVDFATFTMDKTLRGPQGGVIVYRTEFNNGISSSIFPKTQGGPIQNLMFAKTMCFLKLSLIDVHLYAANVIDNANLLLKALNNHNVQTVTDHTQNHIILISLLKTSYTGRVMESRLFDQGIISNRNLIPSDNKGAYDTSGIRLGSIPITNLGYTPEDVEKLGIFISEVITNGYSRRHILESLIEKYHKNINISN